MEILLSTQVITPASLLMVNKVSSHHSIRHSLKHHATRKLHGPLFYRTGVIADRSFTLGLTLQFSHWVFVGFVKAVAEINILNFNFHKVVQLYI